MCIWFTIICTVGYNESLRPSICSVDQSLHPSISLVFSTFVVSDYTALGFIVYGLLVSDKIGPPK